MNKRQMFDYLDQSAQAYTDVSDALWHCAETAFEEVRSAQLLSDALEGLGFSVEQGVGGIATAFCASWGQGGPVIAFLGEYDALSGMGQEAFGTEQRPGPDGANGHGCGHNMLGAASLAAAAAAKEYLAQNGLPGTVRYYGCPGEEGGSGKAFMAREGVFDGVDIALTWHPSYVNGVMDLSLLANYQVLYKFSGRASHAAASPHLGRSALDAVELMNVGVNYLREHILPSARVHYAITDTGGFSPNVVQARAEVLYLIRAPKSGQVEEIYRRVNKVAQGAAMMTETEVEIEFIKSCADIVPNKTLFEVLHNNFQQVEPPVYTEEETAFAGKMMATLTQDNFDKTAFAALGQDQAAEIMGKLRDKTLCHIVLPFDKAAPSKTLPGSSDVGDVSWNVPTGQIVTACYAMGTPAHSWQLVSQGLSSVAHKGLLYAAKVLAGAAVDVLETPALVTAAKEELAKRLDGATYQCAIPPQVKPRPLGKLANIE